MLRFFRQIRQRLLTDYPPDQARRAGRFSKYLLYAIGEILLVVIGILLALQVNNWNEARIKEESVRRHLASLTGAIEHDIREMDISMGFNEFRFHSWQYLLRMSGVRIDSLKEIPRPEKYVVSPWDEPYPIDIDRDFIQASMQHINNAFLGMFFNYSAIREINNLGVISDLDNDSLKVKINEYYYHLDWKFGEQAVNNRHKLAEDLKLYFRDEHAISCNYPTEPQRIFEAIRDDEIVVIMMKDLIKMANEHYWATNELQDLGEDLIHEINGELNHN
jgi:hypothetical protein